MGGLASLHEPQPVKFLRTVLLIAFAALELEEEAGGWMESLLQNTSHGDEFGTGCLLPMRRTGVSVTLRLLCGRAWCSPGRQGFGVVLL